MSAHESTPFLPSAKDQEAWWNAIRHGRLDQVHQYLARDRRWANWPSPRGWEALHEVLITADYGSLDKRLKMIEAVLPYSDVRWSDAHPGDSTPLILASQSCQIEVIRRLLPLSDPRATTGSGMTALHMAASCGHEEVVNELLPLSDPQARTADGHTPVMLAAANGRLNAALALWPSADVHVRNEDGDTVVLLAARVGLAPLLERWRDGPRVDFSVRNHLGQDVTDLWHAWTARASDPYEHARRLALLNDLVARKQGQEQDALADAWPDRLPALPTIGRSRL